MLYYALAIFVSSFLLFQVQPVIAKMILPWFGGSAAVWNTCMLFFQAALLGGYSYAHALFERAAPKRQAMIHIGLLAVSLFALPIVPAESWKPAGGEEPTLRILGLLAVTIGLPYFLLSTTGPLLQAWYSRQNAGAVPYRLFALSNAASLLALVTYPVLVEPQMTSQTQAWAWSGGFALFTALCATVAWRARTAAAPVEAAAETEAEPPRAPGIGLRLLWIALAACPSVLLLSVTTHLTQDVAAIPFLWIVPLVLYLLTFILCFETEKLYWRWVYLPLLVATLAAVGWFSAEDSPDLGLAKAIGAYSAAMFICSMVCHGELASLKPHPRYLTSFYVSLSVGGVMGGLFVGLLAPSWFDTYLEFPIGWWLSGALATVAVVVRYWSWFRSKEGIAAGVVLVALLGVYAGWWVKVNQRQVKDYRLVQRNFYGMLRVEDEGDFTDQSRVRKLVHGVISHGQQYLHPLRRKQPTTYYCAETGAGQALLGRLDGETQNIGLIGLGAGTLASYGRAGDQLHIYEINPLVVHLAQVEFSYLKDSPARQEIHLGDARLTLERQQPMGFDVLLVDAFSGDSVPVHLLTREAFSLYFRHLKPDGVLVVHISNKYLDLEPVVTGNSSAMGLESYIFDDDRDDGDEVCYGSTWVQVMSPGARTAHPARIKLGKELKPVAGFRPWTDGFSNMWSILKK